MNKEQRYMKRAIKEFREFWLANGEPHPNSNEYLAMNRAFFMAAGYSMAVKDMAGQK